MEVPGPPCAFRLLTAKIREILRTFVLDRRGSAPLGCAGSLGRWYRREKSFLETSPQVARFVAGDCPLSGSPLKEFYEETLLRYARLGFQRPPNDGFCVFMGTGG